MSVQYDVIIIGKGPAGISASLYIARAKYKVLVLGKDFGALEKASAIENYYGFAKPISGIDLAQAGVEQARAFGVEVETDEVTAIEQVFAENASAGEGTNRPQFKITTGTEKEYLASAVLIATGKQRTGLRVAGFEEYQGHGISFCAVCDGFFYRDKKIGVIGSGVYAAAEINHLFRLSKDIVLFTNGQAPDDEAKSQLPDEVVIVESAITAIKGSAPANEGGIVSAIETKDGEYAVQGIFVAIGTAGASSFAAKLGLPVGTGMDADTLITGENGTTMIPGIYSAGDSTGGYMQVAKAVSDGAHAAKAIIADLRKK
ncbi:MAG: FAD-dependent oxidoreductase [Spirochaetales bacterium]